MATTTDPEFHNITADIRNFKKLTISIKQILKMFDISDPVNANNFSTVKRRLRVELERWRH